MKKLLALLLLASFPLLAKPYLFEYHGSNQVIIFEGEIKDGNEGKVRSLQTQYLESLSGRNLNRPHYFEVQLNDLGVTVKKAETNPYLAPYSQNTPYFTPTQPAPQTTPPPTH